MPLTPSRLCAPFLSHPITPFPTRQDCASSFTKGNFTYNSEDPGFKGLQRCATLCNVSVFQEDSKSDKSGPVPFKKMKVQGDGSTIEVHTSYDIIIFVLAVSLLFFFESNRIKSNQIKIHLPLCIS